MAQTRKKLLEVLASHLATAVVHRILEDAIDVPEIAARYRKETLNAFEVAKKYRARLHPKTEALPAKDAEALRWKITRKVRAELRLRIGKGYTGVRLEAVGPSVEDAMHALGVG